MTSIFKDGIGNVKRTLTLILFLIAATPALATMPELTDKPSVINSGTCARWATNQNPGDVYPIWGIQEDGSVSNDVAIKRLIDECMGKPMPGIVGFGTSAGFEQDYCGRHPTFGICKKYAVPPPQQDGSDQAPASAPAAPPQFTGRTYPEEVRARIFAHKPPNFPKIELVVPTYAGVVFVINRRGRLLRANLYKSTGHREMDLAALSAVRRAAPFPPTPTGRSIQYKIKIAFESAKPADFHAARAAGANSNMPPTPGTAVVQAPDQPAASPTLAAPPPPPVLEPNKLCLLDICIGDDLSSLEKFNLLPMDTPEVQALGLFLFDPAHITAWQDLPMAIPGINLSGELMQSQLKLNGDTLKTLESNPKVCSYADIEGAYFGTGRQLTFFIVSTDTSADSAVFKVSAVEKEYRISSDSDYDKLIAAISQLNEITLNDAVSDQDKHAMQDLMQQYWQFFYAYTKDVTWKYWAGEHFAIAIQRSGTRLIMQIFSKQGRAAVDAFSTMIKQKNCPPPGPTL
jgi:TonB family protein